MAAFHMGMIKTLISMGMIKTSILIPYGDHMGMIAFTGPVSPTIISEQLLVCLNIPCQRGEIQGFVLNEIQGLP